MSIAILISGAIREQVNLNLALDVIDNLKEQFSFMDKVDIYFTTWNPIKANIDDKYDLDYRSYNKEFIDKIRSKVTYLYLFDRPEDYDHKYDVKIMQEPEMTVKFYRMFYGVNLLCENLQQDYDYVCRCRNDIILKGDFKQSIENLKNNIFDYETTYSFWTYNDCVTDQFCITTQENFFKVWKNDKKEIFRMLEEWKQGPDKCIRFKLDLNNIKYRLFLPVYYLFKTIIYVENSEIIIKNTNGYMHSFLEKIALLKNLKFKI